MNFSKLFKTLREGEKKGEERTFFIEFKPFGLRKFVKGIRIIVSEHWLSFLFFQISFVCLVLNKPILEKKEKKRDPGLRGNIENFNKQIERLPIFFFFFVVFSHPFFCWMEKQQNTPLYFAESWTAEGHNEFDGIE